MVLIRGNQNNSDENAEKEKYEEDKEEDKEEEEGKIMRTRRRKTKTA